MTVTYPAWDGVPPLDWFRLIGDAEAYSAHTGMGSGQRLDAHQQARLPPQPHAHGRDRPPRTDDLLRARCALVGSSLAGRDRAAVPRRSPPPVGSTGTNNTPRS
jgi:hypothetical protein